MKVKRLPLCPALLVVCAVSFHLSARAFAAVDEAPVVTRWMDPTEQVKPLHALPVFPDPLHVIETPREGVAGHPLAPAPPVGRILLVVHTGVYASIMDGLDRYALDLEAMGFTVLIEEYVSGSAEALRDHLAELYQEPESLAGAVFIGNIPYIIYELMQNWGSGDEYEDFPCDIFFMDLDGGWEDSLNEGSVRPNNGKYDTRTGNLDLEIWVSRMRTGNLNALGGESEILSAYFDKNHRYRTGSLRPAKEAVVYDDDDWTSMASSDTANVGNLYGAEGVTTVSERNATTAADYKSNHMTADYELMLIRSHGYPGGHGFYENDRSRFQYVYNSDYRDRDPTAVFNSFFVCSGSDYTASNYLAGTVAFNMADSGLLAWGSTKTGGIWSDRELYLNWSEGTVFGEAFRLWFNYVQDHLSGYAPRWWYGLVIIGDGALRPSLFSDFEASPLTGQAPLEVSFVDQSWGAVSAWSWDFGDGGESAEQHPVYLFTAPGLYDVTLTVDGLGATDTLTRTAYVLVEAAPLLASFTADPASGFVPLEVSFTDQSQGTVTSWWWEFGDGGSSSAQNPVHTYTVPGLYDVALTVEGPGGASDRRVETGYILAEAPPVTAEFEADPTAGYAPLEVTFTDRSQGPVTAWSWDFGDGDGSVEQNPVHVYDAPGTYDVKLTVEGGWSELDAVIKAGFIVVEAVPKTIFRYESRAALVGGTPDAGFATLSLPWVDPDQPLEPGGSALLYYQVTIGSGTVTAVRDGATIRLDDR